ncbi:hypothetical protein Droror1_Dr00028322 [Drosera rotundifolia]
MSSPMAGNQVSVQRPVENRRRAVTKKQYYVRRRRSYGQDELSGANEEASSSEGPSRGLPVNQPRSWSQLGSSEAHPALMLVITAPIGEVSQDAVWDAVDSEESRKFLELRNSKEW